MASLLLPTRRSFLVGAAALIVAPAVVRAASLMPVRAPRLLISDFTDIKFVRFDVLYGFKVVSPDWKIVDVFCLDPDAGTG